MALAELRLVVERQHREVLAEIKRLGRSHREETVLRQLTEIRRALGLTALHERPVGHTRHRPLGRV